MQSALRVDYFNDEFAVKEKSYNVVGTVSNAEFKAVANVMKLFFKNGVTAVYRVDTTDVNDLT